MSANSKIEWTDDTVSFWWGCTRYGEGCRHCYAEKLSKRSGDFWGPQAPRLWIKSAVAECERLNRKAEREGRPRLVFVNSMSDFFEQHDGAVVDRRGQRLYNFEGGYKLFSPTANVGGINPTTIDDLRREAFQTFDRCDWLRFLLLTKRPENILRMWPQIGFADAGVPGTLGRRLHLENVWLGTSVSTQADADRNIPLLLECRDLAPVLFLSIEPLLEDLGEINLAGISWVIVGGESGHGARFCRPEWIRSIRDQCRAAGVACFIKQLGANIVTRNDMIEDTFSDGECGWPDAEVEHHINGFREDYQGADCRVRLQDKKGGDWSEWPEDLRIREFPKLESAR